MAAERKIVRASDLTVFLILALCLVVVPAIMYRILAGPLGVGSAGDEVGSGTKEELEKPKQMPEGLVPFGVDDSGIFADLDAGVSFGLPACARGKDVSLVVNKKKRTLSLLYHGVAVKTYPISLGFTPQGDKTKQGDGRTPEGEYFICEMLDEDLAARYGARSMRLSYPSKKDAVRGLEEGLVTQAQHDAIVAAIEKGEMPPQDTKLGSSIRIHGGGVGEDWTAGCIALRDEDAIEVYDAVVPGTKVTVVSGEGKDPDDADRDGIPDQVDVHVGALKTAMNRASYDSGYFKISYPMGDVARDVGCCTDVVVRALRNAGIDLQVKMKKDIEARPKAYPHIKKANPNIDHRRVMNMFVYMKKHALAVDTDLESDICHWLPGDLVFFDTLPKKGPDHVGIVAWNLDEGGLPMVINNWTWGYSTGEMDLLSWVEVTHHYRLE